MKRIIVPLIFCLALPFNSLAQKRKAKKEEPVNVETLISEYKFDKLAAFLQKELEKAIKDGGSTELIEADLQRTEMAQSMLNATERICFIDSLVVPRKAMLSPIRLSPENGSIAPLTAYFNINPKDTENYGQTAYRSELGDKLYFSKLNKNTQRRALHLAYKFGDNWEKAQPIAGLDQDEEDQDFPFVLNDGVTLYFAAQGNQSIGGYDLFVTRYDPDKKEFLRAENLGMPFNSPANDYLLAFDETRNLGFLVTDRRQPADSVCIYTFIPNESRDMYVVNEENIDSIRTLAALRRIADTQTDKRVVHAALARLQAKIAKKEQNETLRFVINDHLVISSFEGFRSDTARRIAQTLKDEETELLKKKNQLEGLRKNYLQGRRTSADVQKIIQLEKDIPQKETQLKSLYKNLRKSELEARK